MAIPLLSVEIDISNKRDIQKLQSYIQASHPIRDWIATEWLKLNYSVLPTLLVTEEFLRYFTMTGKILTLRVEDTQEMITIHEINEGFYRLKVKDGTGTTSTEPVTSNQ